jgi:signal transduction histidine kinase
MFSPRRLHVLTKSSESISILAVVAIGYAVTLIGSLVGATLEYSPLEAVVAVLLGLIYLALLLFGDSTLTRYRSQEAKLLYFSLLIILVIGIQLLLIGPGMWLISLPIVGTAVEHVSSQRRWPIYLASVGALPLALGIRTGDWNNALSSLLLLMPAVLFVVVITQLRLNERKARREAEQLSGQLEAAHDQLATYAMQVEDLATTKERNRLAREIHDNLGHYLTIVHVQLEASRAMLKHDPDQALDALNKAQKLAQEGLATVRRSVAALRESPVGNRSLADALEALLEDTRNTGIVADLITQGSQRSLDAKKKLALYRIVQEALTNVSKHARASRVDVTLDFRQGDAVRLLVTDNGVGAIVNFDAGFGLIGMRERIQLLDGDLHIEASPGRGFTIEMVVPD